MLDLTKNCIKWIKDYFDNTQNCNAVIGISGGKDSTVVAALCVAAIGPERVFGVMMPNEIQKDLNDSKEVCEYIGIKQMTVDISTAYLNLCNCIYNSCDKFPMLSDQTRMNLPPRLRMATLYGIAQTVNGRVVGTGNFSERVLGWTTIWGDSACDMNPIGNLYVSQVLEIGDDLKLPYHLVHKTPSDGLCGKSDEDKLGFTYEQFERVYKAKYVNIVDNSISDIPENIVKKICERIKSMNWKKNMINIPMFS